MEPVVLFALIGVLGIGAQWLAWRLQMPAIVLILGAGLLAGPVTGLLDPAEGFGDLLRPIVAVAVAVILFEGGLTLNFAELRETRPAIRRLVFVGAPLGWLLAALAIHYGAGLSWQSSAVFGGILVVTGPTVITPLLRQARLKSRPASILRWEAIVNDPVGALCAVLAFEVVAALAGASTLLKAAEHFVLGLTVAAIAGYAAGRGIAFAFRRGQVPEYMKVPVLFGAVLAIYASTDALLHESGLLAVT
ncbi:MAG: cation:proton antiporter, partial [Pseudomonadota bacterium]